MIDDRRTRNHQTRITNHSRLNHSFFRRDVLTVAPELLGKLLIRKFDNGTTGIFMITEVEAYRGEEDQACHASKGKTPRTSVMYEPGGILYIYLIYGMYWMMNVVTGPAGHPQAVLIRGIKGYDGPGKLTRHLKIDKTFNKEDLPTSTRMWLEDTGLRPGYTTSPRIGVDYAGDYWKNVPWRFIIKS
ncbi:MAG: DNA-3-methyladenine glycosylase [Bacteroidales bacterium]|nr:DNA-3-methyladenine glycosylase [Bacteroidales bacterium]